MSEQLNLDVFDTRQELSKFIHDEGGNNWYIFFTGGKLYLGKRYHDLGGTDYEYLKKISIEDAEWLRSKRFKTIFHGEVPVHLLYGNEIEKAKEWNEKSSSVTVTNQPTS